MRLSIPDMSCGHCKAVVEKTIAAEDPSARVAVDLTERVAEVETTADPARLIAALRAEGYEAEVAG